MEAREKKKASNFNGETQVIVEILNEEPKGYPPKALESSSEPKQIKMVDFDSTQKVPVSCPSPETSRFFPSPNKPPKIPTPNGTPTRRNILNRSVFSKPKSRFGEPSSAPIEDHNNSSDQGVIDSSFRSSFSRASSPNNLSTGRSQKFSASHGHDDEAEEIYNKVALHKEKHRKLKARFLIEWCLFIFLFGCLTASLTVKKLETYKVWSLELWRWCVLVMVIFCGNLMTNWFMHIVVFVIERNFLLEKKVVYFVHGLKKSVQIFIWLGFVLLTWVLVFNHGIKRSKSTNKILRILSWTLVTLLVGSFLWLVKTLLLKILASNFHVNTFFDRIQESIFHQYVVQTLSGPPLIEEAERVGRSPSMGQLSFTSTKKGGKKSSKESSKRVIDMAQLHKMKQEKVSAWTMKVLIDAVSSSGLSTISNQLDEMETVAKEQNKEITSEMEATAAAYHIFRNVAQPGSKYIDEDDLLRFMIKEEVDLVFPMFGSENGRVDRKALTDWVLLAAAFMFKDTCKTIFEALVFIFVMHPFDVGDRCVIDGIPLLVEEMNILNTVFLKLNNEKVYYPNAVLSTKPISNYYRSSDMGDTVEFSIDFNTPVEKIALLREKIKKYLEENPQTWHPIHRVVVLEIENVNKLKMALYPNHTINFQEYGERNRRRSELVMELKRIFEEIHIKYYLLPQTVHLDQKI
ncbi:hypothetical protein CsatB_006338 [Cannabis sativa]